MREVTGKCRVTFPYTGEFRCSCRYVKYGLVPLHPTHTQDNIYPLTTQYNEVGFKYPPRQVEWDFSDYPICIHSASGCTNRIWGS
jgi:hypothetical protein